MKRLAVNVGDVLEIEGRLYDVVPDKPVARHSNQRSRCVKEILVAHGLRALTSEEFGAYFGDLPSDSEG